MGINPFGRLKEVLAKARNKLRSRPMATEKDKGVQEALDSSNSQEHIDQNQDNGQEQLARETLESLQDSPQQGTSSAKDGFLARIARAHREARASSKEVSETKPRVGGESPRIALSGPMLLALSLVLVCAVAWAFFMGLMVGRGQNPQESLPTMAAIVGTSDSEQQKDTEEDLESNGSSGQIPPAKNTEAQSPASQGPAGALPVPSAGVHAPPSGAAAAAWPDATGMRPKPVPAPKPAAAPKPNLNDRQIYDFVYQAAAFKNNVDAQKIQKALNGKNIRSTVRRSGKVYLLLVNFRGTVGQAEKMIGTMRSVGLGKPMQLSRTTVENSKRKK